MTKILHILDHSIPLHDGYAFRSQNLFRAQQKMGYQPVVLTSSKHEENWNGPYRHQETFDGVPYYRSGASHNSPVPFFPEILLMRKLYKKIKEIAEIECPDILHAHSPVLNAIPALMAGKRLNLPVVYEIRAFWEDAGVDQGTYKEWSTKYKLVRNLETYACKKASHVAILCDGLKQDLVRRGIPAGKITPVFNGINPDDFKPTPPDSDYLKQWDLGGKKVIGFIGSFYRYEGLDLLIKAFARIAPNHPDTVLLLVGGGEMEQELKALASKLGMLSPPGIPASMHPSDYAPRVIFPGRIPHDRIPGIYSMIDILAYPRYPIRLTELVTPLKPLEAMAMDIALVASDVGGHKELIRHNDTGFLFRAGDENGLGEALESLLNHPEKRHSLQKNGYTWVHENHTWMKTTSVYKKIYSLKGNLIT